MELQISRATYLYTCLSLIGLIASYDLFVEFQKGHSPEWSFHLALETILVGLASLAIVHLFNLLKHEQVERRHIGKELESTSAELIRTESKLTDERKAFLALICGQFDRWELTPCEKQVALLILKGLSFDEIAEVRDTSARTARKQAAAIYRKSNLKNRNEFAAWFFEDLLSESASVDL